MNHKRKWLFALVFAGIVGGLVVFWSASSSSQEIHQAKSSSNPVQVEPKKPSQESLSKSAPANAATREPPAKDSKVKEPPPRPKVLTLAEAVILAEKLGKGQAVKAERKDKPEVSFKIEVVGLDGLRNRILLNATGKVLTEAPEEETKKLDKKRGKK